MGKIWTIVGSVLAVVVIGAFGFCTVWTVRNWDTVYKSLDGSSVYTNEDIKRTEQETWEKAAKNETEYKKTIAELRDLVTSLQVDNAAKSDELAALTLSVSSNESEIRRLSARKASLEAQVANLQDIKAENENTITRLNSQIAVLQTQADQIPTLNAQITNLQSTVNQLQAVNDSTSQTINNLNTQIIGLNNQIRDLSEASQNANAQVALLTNRCNELQASINKYESFINTQENSEQAVATYEVDGSVWKIEIISKGSEITLPYFISTDTLIFNGWTIGGNNTLLGNTYTIDTNTKFVADVTHKYYVQFINDNVVYNSQYVIENESAIVPVAPLKDGYEFLGWSLNGVDTINNIETTSVNINTSYYAVYSKIHTVTFMVDSEILNTQNILNGSYVTVPTSPIKDGYDFLGWSLNGIDIIDNIETIGIRADTVYYAIFVRKLRTATFMSNDETVGYVLNVPYGSVIGNIDYIPQEKTNYVFIGWSDSLNNLSNIDLETYVVTENVSFYPIFEQTTFTITVYDGDNVLFNTQVDKGSSIDLSGIEEPTRAGFVFCYWLYSENNLPVSMSDYVLTLPNLIEVSSDMSYYAAFSGIFNGFYGLPMITTGLEEFYVKASWKHDDVYDILFDDRKNSRTTTIEDIELIRNNGSFFAVYECSYNENGYKITFKFTYMGETATSVKVTGSYNNVSFNQETCMLSTRYSGGNVVL